MPFLAQNGPVCITSLCSVAEISLLSILSGTCGHHIPGGHFCPTHRSSQKLAIFPKITSEGQNVLFLSSGITENQSQCPIWTSYWGHWKVILSTFLVYYSKSGEKAKLLFSSEMWGYPFEPNFSTWWVDNRKKFCMLKSWVIRCRKLPLLKFFQYLNSKLRFWPKSEKYLIFTHLFSAKVGIRLCCIKHVFIYF